MRELVVLTRRPAPLALFALFLVSVAFGQVDTGSIAGTVRDPSGAVIQGAVVKVGDQATGISISSVTNSQGLYSVPDLKVGTYTISAVAPGFETVKKSGIEVRVQDRIPVDFSLSLGAASTVVSVESQAPALQTETSSLGQVVETNQIQSTPLNGRNYIQLATLGAGTTPAVGASERNSFYANGVREIQNSYLLDGIDNKNKIVGFDNSAAQSIEPVIDSVQEFKVQTSTFSAEFGQAAGAVINVTTKSGTNEFHGSAFEYLRNSFFDADPYFQPGRTAKPQFIQNQYGSTFGGPVIKNRTFFFFGWQGTRTDDAAPQLATVPTDLQRADKFTAPLYDPNTTIKNPNGSGYIRTLYSKVNGYYQIPVSQLDPVAQKALTLFPEPNLSGAVNYFSNQKETIAQDQMVGRADHRFSDKDSIFFRYSTEWSTNQLPSVLPPPANNFITVTPAAHSFSTSETHIFSPYLVNEARAGYQETQEIQQADGAREFDQFGIVGAPDYPQVHGLPTFAISGLTTIGTAGIGTLQTLATGSNNLPIDKEGRTIQASDNLTWIRGRHTLKFGVDFQQVTLYANVTLNARPSYTFTGVYTQNPQSRTGTGAAFADFLLGETATATVGTRSDTESRQHIYQGYVQDDWKISSKLTVNAGLRYELPLPWYETSNTYTDLIDEPGYLYGTLLQAKNAGQYGYRNSFVDPNYNNFAPRLGLAYQLTPKTVIRAAAGIFYGRDENLAVANRPTNNPPQYVTTTYTTDQIDPNLILSQGFPSNALNPNATAHPSVNSFLKHSPTPRVNEWNFTVQRDLGAGFTLQAAYVGSNAHDLYTPLNVDQPLPGPGAVQARRPLTAYTAVNVYGPWINSHYNSLQTQVEHKFTRGVTLLAAYTYGHSIDNDGTHQNSFNLASDKGDSTFDLRHRFVLSSVYELPFGKGKPFVNSSALGSAILGGWQLSGIFSAETGLPFTVTTSVDNSNTGTTERANLIGNGLLSSGQSATQWFNVADFTLPPQYTFGNSGRDILRGPSQTNLDLGLSRTIPIAERLKAEFRAEAFNLLNTPQLGLPNAVVGTSTFGQITTTINAQRELQFALRLAF
jgi:hypothetical protein